VNIWKSFRIPWFFGVLKATFASRFERGGQYINLIKFIYREYFELQDPVGQERGSQQALVCRRR
jgi:hypothetical protein